MYIATRRARLEAREAGFLDHNICAKQKYQSEKKLVQTNNWFTLFRKS